MATALFVLTMLLAWLLPPAAWGSGILLLLVLAILLAYRLGWNGSPLVIEPSAGDGPELAVLFIQGEGHPGGALFAGGEGDPARLPLAPTVGGDPQFPRRFTHPA